MPDIDEYDNQPEFTDDDADFFELPPEEKPAPAAGKQGRRFSLKSKKVLLGCIGLPFLLMLICGGGALIMGNNFLKQVQEQLLTQVSPTPIVTLVATADLSVLNTPTPPPATTTPTATPAPPSGAFSGNLNGARVDLGQSIGLELLAQDGYGITTLLINDNGQTIFSERYPSQTEIRFTRNWSPISDGRHRLTAEITSTNGEKTTVAETVVFVSDPDFIERNQPVFARVEANVAALRGLTLQSPIHPYLMGIPDLRRYLRESGYTSDKALDDSFVLSLFDLIPRGSNLYEDSLQYTSTNILGFYDPATDEMAIISNNPELNALDEYTYAHELMHALQDQHFTLNQLTSEDHRIGSDSQLALRALAEGEAELLQELYLEQGYIDQSGKTEIFNAISKLPRMGQSPSLVDIPEVLVRTADFPYVDGKEFAQAVYNRGGWAGLNESWTVPPQSTEQILHPDRYLNGDQPQIVTLQPLEPLLGDDWRLLRSDTLGELYLRLMFERQLNGDDTNFGATGWGGDSYQAFINDANGELLLVWRSAWDDPTESDHFGAAYNLYAEREYGTTLVEVYPEATCRQTIDLVCALRLDNDWLIVRAADAETAAALIASQLVASE